MSNNDWEEQLKLAIAQSAPFDLIKFWGKADFTPVFKLVAKQIEAAREETSLEIAKSLSAETPYIASLIRQSRSSTITEIIDLIKGMERTDEQGYNMVYAENILFNSALETVIKEIEKL